MKLIRVLLPLLLLISLLSRAMCQVLPFRNYTTEDGLSSNYALTLCVDSLGVLWIGSEEGLSRYDGISFSNYTVADGLGFSRVNIVMESRHRPLALWVGTNGGGVTRVVDGVFRNYKIGDTQWSNVVNTMVEDTSGALWVGTPEGISRLRSGHFEKILPKSGIMNVISMSVTDDGTFWILTETQLFSLSAGDSTLRRVTVPLRSKENLQSSYVDGQHLLWIGGTAGTLLGMKTGKVLYRVDLGQSTWIASITEDPGGILWVGTNKGLMKVDEPGVTSVPLRYTSQNGLPTDYIVAGVMDHEGDLWVASNSKGIAKLSNFHLLTFRRSSAQFAPNNSTAVADSNSHVWSVSEEGLWECWLDPAHGWMRFHHSEIRRGNGIYPSTLTFRRASDLWIGFNDGYLVNYHVNQAAAGESRLRLNRMLVPGRDFPKAEVMFLMFDADGKLWCSMGGNKGVFLLDPRLSSPFIRALGIPDGLPDESVRAILQDRTGALWFGGFADGLVRLGEGGIVPGKDGTSKSEELPNRSIRALLEDDHGTLWVGMRYGGLAFHEGEGFRTLSLSDGLLSNAIWCLSESPEGKIWVGTQMGIQLLDPLTHRMTSRQEMTGFPVWSCGETRNGTLYYISAAGLTFYDYRRDTIPRVPPPVQIRRFQVNGVDVPLEGDHSFSHTQDNCTVEIRGVSLRDERGLRYQYRLLGSGNEEWQQPTRNRTIAFAALAPGSYTFVAKAVNGDGTESLHPVTLSFTIQRPVWFRWWFVAGGGGIVLLLAIAVVRLRVNRLLAIERLRNRIATDLHDDIGSGLTRIAILSDVARRQAAKAGEANPGVPEMGRVAHMARELMETMSDVVWSIDPAHESVERMIQRLRSFAYELSEAGGMTLHFEAPDEVLRMSMSGESLRSILLLTKEALTNVAKHSHGRSVNVMFRVSVRSLMVTIADDGAGFDVSAAAEGNGLVNMQKRAAAAGGTFSITSERAKGTTIEASFPAS